MRLHQVGGPAQVIVNCATHTCKWMTDACCTCLGGTAQHCSVRAALQRSALKSRARWRCACKVYLLLISIIRNLKVVIAVDACRLIRLCMHPRAILGWPLGLQVCPWAAEPLSQGRRGTGSLLRWTGTGQSVQHLRSMLPVLHVDTGRPCFAQRPLLNVYVRVALSAKAIMPCQAMQIPVNCAVNRLAGSCSILS